MQCCMCVRMRVIRLIQSTNRVAVHSGSPRHNSGDKVNKTYNTTQTVVMASSAVLEVFNAELEKLTITRSVSTFIVQRTRFLTHVKRRSS